MGKVRAQLAVSLDGFMAGPEQSQENPLGKGGMALHEWVFKLPSWRESHQQEGGEGDPENPSEAVMAAVAENVGAVVMGRNMFGPVRGEWGDSDWRGWWGEEPPYHAPVFVLTHHPHEPIEMAGGTTFHFVTEGVESAVAQAKAVAGEQDVSVAGGASAVQQCIAAKLIDEILVNQVPILLGDGERLFDGLGSEAVSVELAEVIEGREALHLTYRFG